MIRPFHATLIHQMHACINKYEKPSANAIQIHRTKIETSMMQIFNSYNLQKNAREAFLIASMPWLNFSDQEKNQESKD